MARLQRRGFSLKIALLEDDADQAEVIRHWLEAAEHACSVSATGADMLRRLRRDTFDLLLLDWETPDTSGIEVLQWVRANIDWPVPVVFTTRRESEEDIVSALAKGADDYLTKPVSRGELLARIEAVARRARPQAEVSDELQAPPYVLQRSLRTVRFHGQSVELSPKEFELAYLVFASPGRLLSRTYLLESVWGLNASVETRTVDSHVSRLRRKLQLKPENGWRLSSVYNHGYRLERVPGASGGSN